MCSHTTKVVPDSIGLVQRVSSNLLFKRTCLRHANCHQRSTAPINAMSESDDPLYSDLRLMVGARCLLQVTLLLDCGAGVNSRDVHGRTPLMWAAVGGHLPTLRLLLERGADINAACDDGRTALMRAACYGHREAVRCLIDNGADVNAKTLGGVTALSSTRSAHNPDGAVTELLKAGAVEQRAETDV